MRIIASVTLWNNIFFRKSVAKGVTLSGGPFFVGGALPSSAHRRRSKSKREKIEE
jgi:hypothetical protein